MTHSTLLRQLQMLKLLPKSPGNKLTKQLAEELAELGFSVNIRTIQRDLVSMERLFGLSCTDSAEGNRWCYISRHSELTPNMNSYEALMLLLAEQLLFKTLPKSSLSFLDERIDKARETLEKSGHLEQWQDKFKLLPGELPLLNLPLSEQIHQAVFSAVLKEQRIIIDYKKNHDTPAQQYHLNPRALVIRDNIQYLIASKQQTPDKPQTFILSRIQSVTETYQDISPQARFDMTTYMATNPTGYLLAQEPIPVVLQVTGAAARVLMNNQLSDDQQLRVLDDIWLEVRATVPFTYDLIGWLCRYAGMVKVLQPQRLQQQVISRMQQGLALYTEA